MSEQTESTKDLEEVVEEKQGPKAKGRGHKADLTTPQENQGEPAND